MEIRGLTLVQPWASLIAWGVKTIETRSWLPGRVLRRDGFVLVIHAGVKVDAGACATREIAGAMRARGVTVDDLPRGAVLGVTAVRKAERHPGELGPVTLEQQRPFGWFGEGRCYWHLVSPDPETDLLSHPLPYRGSLGLWRPDGRLRSVLEAELPRSTFVRGVW